MNKSLTVLVVLVMFFASFSTIAVGANEKDNGEKAFLDGQSQDEIADKISQMSTKPMIGLAKKFGITTIHGKDITKTSSKGTESPKNLQDRPVGTNPITDENEPSIAAKPNSTSTVIAASHDLPNAPCAAYRSTDGGGTWTKSFLPLLLASDVCSDPVVRWAPDGGRVYAIYMSIRGDFSTADIVVSSSTNNGASWGTPVVAIAGSASKFPDKPWGDVHTFESGTNAKNKLYVTATLFNSDGSIDIGFSRSTNGGSTFPDSGAPFLLASESANVLQGSRPIGGKSYTSASGDVLVCWYNSNADSWLSGSFSIRCRSSGTYGSTLASFGAETIAVDNTPFALFETPYWLGPFSQNHRWWGSMFPSMIISNDGSAHLAYTADPVAGSDDSEDGNIYYIKSPGAPYTGWTPPTMLNDGWDYKAQGYVSITSKKLSSDGSVLYADWEDHRNSPWYNAPPGFDCGSAVENCFYDIYSDQTSPAWSWDTRVTDVSSMSDYIFVGDYKDTSTSRSTSSAQQKVHTIWTDRSDKVSIFDLEDDVYSDRVYLDPN